MPYSLNAKMKTSFNNKSGSKYS